ncbi:outer membrane beta-barrel protein [Vibrio navarrensis]|uniref:outer membrane beta-barrel protein n=1 Tax=Vibrio navarrensis TaxID=29495 RepID=UPI0013022C63|nr:outer membrane beta-barrel protein [Vibrio navarrensis]
MKSNQRPLTLLVGLILAGQAPLALAINQSGQFYVGGKAGLTLFSDQCGASYLDCDEHSEGFGVYGGYQATDWLALELGYDALGKAKVTYPTQNGAVVSDDVRVKSIEAGIKADWALSERIGVFGKTGTLIWLAEKGHSQSGQPSTEVDDRGSSVMLGAGLEYRLSEQWNTRLEYQYFNNVGGDNGRGTDVHFIGVGLDYRFGALSSMEMAEPVEMRPVDEVVMSEPEPMMDSMEEPEPEVIETYTQVVSSAFGEALFESGSTSLSPSLMLQLQPLLERLEQYPETVVEISGHTDSIGSEAVNQRLSEQRAQSVANYLISKGVDPERITRVAGYGESLPVASNDTVSGRAQNRRVEIVSPETMSSQSE